ncbi:Uncharacterized protein Adt_10394 [Abeliophyllum distichum]|uniref:Uncharacterized protein n=1 Tax=Abeliophyllum distichum TaxID=126358 RepID=A0ABD1UK29_9LAMI
MATTFPMLTYAPPVRASSVDTHQRLSYNPHRTYPKKPEESLSSTPSTASSTNRNHTNISDLLKRETRITRQESAGEMPESRNLKKWEKFFFFVGSGMGLDFLSERFSGDFTESLVDRSKSTSIKCPFS